MVGKQDRIRSNEFKLDPLRFYKGTNKKWLSKRVVDEKQRLGSHVLSASTIKRYMNSCIRRKGGVGITGKKKKERRNVTVCFH